MTELKSVVAHNITQLRSTRSMTQLELGEFLNYSDKAVSKWERGESIPDVFVLKQIADLFEVTVDYLLIPHTEDELPVSTEVLEYSRRRKRLNHRTITSISVLGVFALATLLYSVLFLCGYPQWLVFIYAVPVANIVWLVLNSLWGHRAYTIFLVSSLLWTVITTVFLTFIVLGYNFWILFIIGIIPQIIILLCPLFFQKH